MKYSKHQNKEVIDFCHTTFLEAKPHGFKPVLVFGKQKCSLSCGLLRKLTISLFFFDNFLSFHHIKSKEQYGTPEDHFGSCFPL